MQWVGYWGKLITLLKHRKNCRFFVLGRWARCMCGMARPRQAVGSGVQGYVGAGQAPQFVISFPMLPDPVSGTWGWFPPSAPSRLLWGQHRHLGAGSRAQQPLCICEILCSSSARGGEWVSPFNSITKQIQDPASWASSILIGISTRTPAPAEHFYRTENKFSNKPEWLNQETVGRDLYIEHTGIPNQIKQPKHVSPAPCYLNAMSTFWGGSANCTWFCSEKFGFRALIRLMWRERRILAPLANVIHCRLQHASSHPSLLLHFIVFFPPIKTLRPMTLFCSVLCIHWSNQGRSGAS